MKTDRNIQIQAMKKTLVWSAGILVVLLLGLILGPRAWLLLVAFGLVICAIGGRRLLEANSARMWPTVQASIIETGVGQHIEPEKYSPLVYYYPEIRLRYEADGVQFEVATYGLVQGDFRSLEKHDAERLANEYRTGGSVRLYVSPENPERAVLVPSISSYQASSSWALVVGGIIVIALGIGAGLLNAL